MRERARDKGRLQDIIEYADNVTMLIKGFDLEMLVTDKRTYYSVVKNIEVVGEPSTTFPYCASRWRSISPRPTGKGVHPRRF